MSSLFRRYEARPDSVAEARRDVVAFAAAQGVDGDGLTAIRLAVSEAVTNAVLHGFRGAPGEVELRVVRDADGLAILVRDGGAGLSVPSRAPGLGCGLEIIAEVADEMSVRPAPAGGTELRMRFALSGQPLVAAAAAA